MKSGPCGGFRHQTGGDRHVVIEDKGKLQGNQVGSDGIKRTDSWSLEQSAKWKVKGAMAKIRTFMSKLNIKINAKQ